MLGMIVVALVVVGCNEKGGGPEPMMMSGTDAGPGPDPDAGPEPDPDPVDAGPDPEPEPSTRDATVRLAEACEGFDPCGGDEGGRWEYAEVCAEPDFGAARELCPSATVEGSGTVRGTVTFAGGTVTRDATSHVEMTVTFPASCGVTPYCSMLGAMIGGSCNPSGGDCVCDVVDDARTTTATAYAASGSQIVLEDGTRYDYCVDGGRLVYRELGDEASERGVARLER
jgi:hypothetical protein